MKPTKKKALISRKHLLQDWRLREQQVRQDFRITGSWTQHSSTAKNSARAPGFLAAVNRTTLAAATRPRHRRLKKLNLATVLKLKLEMMSAVTSLLMKIPKTSTTLISLGYLRRQQLLQLLRQLLARQLPVFSPEGQLVALRRNYLLMVRPGSSGAREEPWSQQMGRWGDLGSKPKNNRSCSIVIHIILAWSYKTFGTRMNL